VREAKEKEQFPIQHEDIGKRRRGYFTVTFNYLINYVQLAAGNCRRRDQKSDMKNLKYSNSDVPQFCRPKIPIPPPEPVATETIERILTSKTIENQIEDEGIKEEEPIVEKTEEELFEDKKLEYDLKEEKTENIKLDYAFEEEKITTKKALDEIDIVSFLKRDRSLLERNLTEVSVSRMTATDDCIDQSIPTDKRILVQFEAQIPEAEKVPVKINSPEYWNQQLAFGEIRYYYKEVDHYYSMGAMGKSGVQYKEDNKPDADSGMSSNLGLLMSPTTYEFEFSNKQLFKKRLIEAKEKYYKCDENLVYDTCIGIDNSKTRLSYNPKL